MKSMRIVFGGMTRSLAALLISVATITAAEDRAAAVRSDLTNVVSAGGWIYNDLPRAFKEAAKARKPMLVVFRCIP